MNKIDDIYGKYSLIPLLNALEDLKENQTACLEQIHYYEEAISYGDVSCKKNLQYVTKDLDTIKELQQEIKMYLIPLSN
jgi:hypothetical protein